LLVWGRVSRRLREPVRRRRHWPERCGGCRSLRERLRLSARFRVLLAQWPAHLPLNDTRSHQRIESGVCQMTPPRRRTEMTIKTTTNVRRWALCTVSLALAFNIAAAPVYAQVAAAPAQP